MGNLNLMNKRAEFATRAMSTENFRALCREYGISARVGYKWRASLYGPRYLRDE